jgi:hypothetical protein
MSQKKRATKLYEDFRETKVKRTRGIRIRYPKAVAIMGYCEAILYSTTHNGVAKLYKHKFAKGSRALLCAGPGKSQLYLIGGRFHVTDRGIVDLTPSGREIPD